jgi:hypothetical protein
VFTTTTIAARIVSSRVCRFALAATAITIAFATSSASAHAATVTCRDEGVGYSSAPFDTTMTGVICNNGSSGSCPDGIQVSTSTAWWADPFVSVTGIRKGCYWIDSYGGAESMWANVQVTVTDPAEPWDSLTETVWLRIAMTHNGTTHKQAGATVDS